MTNDDPVAKFEKWQSQGLQYRDELLARRGEVLKALADGKAELDRLNDALEKLGVRPAVRQGNHRGRGQGNINPNRYGWRWSIARDGKRYTGPTVATKEEAEAGRVAAAAALAAGIAPDMAAKRRRHVAAAALAAPPAAPKPGNDDEEDEGDGDRWGEIVGRAAPPPTPIPLPRVHADPPSETVMADGRRRADAIPRPRPDDIRPAPPAKRPRPPSAPDPGRLQRIAEAAERTGGVKAGDAAGDMAKLVRGIDRLPSRLANVARRAWLRGQSEAVISRELQITTQAVAEMLHEARDLAIAPGAA